MHVHYGNFEKCRYTNKEIKATLKPSKSVEITANILGNIGYIIDVYLLSIYHIQVLGLVLRILK